MLCTKLGLECFMTSGGYKWLRTKTCQKAIMMNEERIESRSTDYDGHFAPSTKRHFLPHAVIFMCDFYPCPYGSGVTRFLRIFRWILENVSLKMPKRQKSNPFWTAKFDLLLLIWMSQFGHYLAVRSSSRGETKLRYPPWIALLCKTTRGEQTMPRFWWWNLCTAWNNEQTNQRYLVSHN